LSSEYKRSLTGNAAAYVKKHDVGEVWPPGRGQQYPNCLQGKCIQAKGCDPCSGAMT
jgi:hypothetical protein